MDRFTYLNDGNATYINTLYDTYRHDPASVESGWRKFFEGFDLGFSREATNISDTVASPSVNPAISSNEIKVLQLIEDYRNRGHLFSKTNPVRERRKHLPGKELTSFGLADSDLDTVFNAGNELGLRPGTLRQIRRLLEEVYCGSTGIEYKYLNDPVRVKWFQARIEIPGNKPPFSSTEKKRILCKLNQAVVFESFLATKFIGQKRFSLEGAEGLIPAMDLLIQKCASNGVEEIVIGMGHRGRLNVLANLMEKPYEAIFREFLGKKNEQDTMISGDVKYHLGYSNDVATSDGKTVHLSLSPNPSHLEAVNAVVEGMTRSKADYKYNGDHSKILPILLHGDASITGQGVVYEVLQMEKLKGYHTGGTIHLVINNQVGFTTDYKDSRSSIYCTDLAKITGAPVFHVNGDDAEALVHVTRLALDYRQTFHGDVFIDILCYRKYGHNESDEPKFTQPVLYKAIDQHPNPRDIYIRQLIAEKSIDVTLPGEIETSFRKQLQASLDEARQDGNTPSASSAFQGVWQGLRRAKDKDFSQSPDTAITEASLLRIGNGITTLPKGKIFLKKVEKLFEHRHKMVNETKVFDWAMAELLAYGSLLQENHTVRLTGEDVKRGTFSHRHATVTDTESEEEIIPLNCLGTTTKFDIHNSLLSEYGVLGFEYGYASANPHALVLWEAQFGDFLNTGQVIVDQYIASAETKWQLGNGLVMLLPHGHEGQGPEHTSARIERFLELCANNNIQLVNCTTPANFFHVLRRQLKRDFRIPLIIFTPKSLLRHPLCVSPVSAFTTGRFQELIDDTHASGQDVKRVLFCSGKIYYDLFQKRQETGRNDVAIVRIEQLYPMPFTQMQSIRDKYTDAKEFIWVQEEPENMGPWPYLCRKFYKHHMQLHVISRPESGSTATGYAMRHANEQETLLNRAFEKDVNNYNK
ncbi:2-oxoglutarate dehydrogenase E1 component [Chitinophaga pinensis]|uniref:oxoglutarate dehydrogenase (succinyl-transferring) n=1 Tax=Chitinophaga pinensis (strain ATCC 43595 / DSM 2588 / LMG 13176 / NBRC 15968 / NCIMB 11800 / UQM 2034) TaxID=485918 RepID=A0A979GAB6_CHIPD|nr:2-oxoglutarate dehydrogenase E1 component [Chitinophaga pinensis]ACU63535.1 2-oxoglutarate dehydrogenase, E1 subunit [Chitinophaga pinensis DSM 2588]